MGQSQADPETDEQGAGYFLQHTWLENFPSLGSRRQRGGQHRMLLAGDEKTDTDPNQVSGTGILDDGKGQGRSGQDHRQSRRGQQCVDPRAGHDAQRRDDTCPLSLGCTAANDVDGVLTGGDIEQEAGKHEQREIISDALSSAPSPSEASRLWPNRPVLTPAAVITPALHPWAMDRDITNIIS